MEEVSLNIVNQNLLELMEEINLLRRTIEDEDNLEVSEEVIKEINEAKKRQEFYSQEEVEKMFS
jgi:transcription termination factor Rho